MYIHTQNKVCDQLMESADSSAGSQQPNLPPGFRFHPTDEELVVHYLKKKAASAPIPVSVIADISLYKFDPWELPAKATFGEQEWYFFTPRDRKYPNGARPNRAATSGYWKATGTDKPVMSSGGTQKVGVKKALVFYGGKPPKGIKTNWIMHEYRLANNKANTKPPGCDVGNKKGPYCSRLDDWVLCRIYKKSNTQKPMDQDRDDYSMNNIITSMPPPPTPSCPQNPKFQALKSSNFGAFLENDQTLFEGMINNNCINNNGYSKTQMINLKRTLPSLYWNDESTSNTSFTKRFNYENSNDGVVARAEDHNHSIATLLNCQLPQTPSLHQQTYEQSPVTYQQFPGMNWYP